MAESIVRESARMEVGGERPSMLTRPPDSYEEVQVRQAVVHGHTLWGPVSVNDFPVEAVLDTRAEITILLEVFASRLGKLGF